MSSSVALASATAVVAVDVGKTMAAILVTDAGRHRLLGPVEVSTPKVSAVDTNSPDSLTDSSDAGPGARVRAGGAVTVVLARGVAGAVAVAAGREADGVGRGAAGAVVGIEITTGGGAGYAGQFVVTRTEPVITEPVTTITVTGCAAAR